MKKFCTTSILLVALMMIGVSASAQEADVSPIIGAWDYAIDTPDGTYRGVLTVADSADVLTGSLVSESEGDRVYEMDSITFEESDLAFSFPHPQYGSISAELTLAEDELEGTLNVPGEGDFPMTGTRHAPTDEEDDDS